SARGGRCDAPRAEQGHRDRRERSGLHPDRPDEPPGAAVVSPRAAGGDHVRLHALPRRDRVPDDDGEVREAERGALEGEGGQASRRDRRPGERHARRPRRLRETHRRRSGALEGPDRPARGGRARRRAVRRALLLGPRQDRALAGGRRARPRGPAVGDLLWSGLGTGTGVEGSRESEERMNRARVLGGLFFVAIAAFGVAAYGADTDAHPSELFKQNCAKCHGENGKADTTRGKNLKARNFTDAEWQG